MADIYLKISDQPDAILEAISTSMAARAEDPALRAISDAYMSGIPFPDGGDAIEIGCGSCAATQTLLSHIDPGRLLCTDPAEGLLDRVPEVLRADPRLAFHVAGAEATGQPGESFDMVLAHTVYSHLGDPDAALAEALRILRPGGHLVVFDGDYAANTVALFDGDPMQSAMEIVQRNMIHGPYVMRSLVARAGVAGFAPGQLRSFSYVKTDQPDYFAGLISRGLDAGVATGEIDAGFADGFRAEVAARVAAGRFFGAIQFICMTARKPG